SQETNESTGRNSRVLFRGHRLDRLEGHKVQLAVKLEWNGEVFEGVSVVPDLPLDRLEGAADATLRTLELVLASGAPPQPSPDDRLAFALQGAKVVGAFTHEYVLVTLNAIAYRSALSLTGSAQVGESMLRGAVLATLQATNRWVQLRLNPGASPD
ncbi:MAG: hypothetical protein EA422_00210, partial [Gemmatimonadales bacterium]